MREINFFAVFIISFLNILMTEIGIIRPQIVFEYSSVNIWYNEIININTFLIKTGPFKSVLKKYSKKIFDE